MEMLLSFVAGLVLAGIVAFFVLRSVKSSATDALTKALDDAAKQAETEKKAAVATLEADLKNAKDNLEQAKSDDIQDASLNIVQYVQPEEIVTTRQILSVDATEQAWKTQSRDIQSNINDLQKLLSL